MKIEFIELEGKRYPLSFSLSTSSEITNRYKNLHALQYMLKSDKTPLSKKVDVLCVVIAAMMYSGCQYYNAFRKQPYDKAPIDDDGKFVPLTAEQVSLVLVPNEENIAYLTAKIESCFSSSSKRELSGAVKNTKKKRKNAKR